MTKKQNLGKLLPVGDTFQTTTKRMEKNRGIAHNCRGKLTYEVLRPGTQRMFTKGKRRYFCEVLALIKTETGQRFNDHVGFYGPRWWMFTYYVKIIEN